MADDLRELFETLKNLLGNNYRHELTFHLAPDKNQGSSLQLIRIYPTNSCNFFRSGA